MTQADNLTDLTLSDVLRLFYQAKTYILVGALLGGLLAVVLLFVLKSQYEVWMIVAPPRQGAESTNFLTEDVSPVLASMVPQTSGARDGEYIRFRQSLRGPAVASVLIKMEGVLSELNEKTLLAFGRNDFSDARDIAKHLDETIRLDPVGDTESIRVVYRHPDPEFGVKLLRNLVKIDDQLIRLDVRKDVEARIDWLKRELKTTLNPEHRQALTRLLMAEERRKMLLSIETPYAVSVIEDATASPQPVAPKAVLLVPFFAVFGMVCAFLVFYVRRQFEQDS